MTHSQTLLSPTQALLRAFCSTTQISPIRSLSPRVSRPKPAAQIRHAAFMRPQMFASNNIAKSTADPFPDVVRDDAIRAQYVRMPTPEGGLSPPQPLHIALSHLQEGTEHLVQISKVDDSGTAICRIMTNADLQNQKREKERVQKEQKKSLKQSVPKQIELNWAIGPNDLEHKLSQLKGFIEAGKRVEVVLASKRRQRQATTEEGTEVLRKVREKVAEADGRETKPMQGGVVGKHTVLTVRKRGLD